MANVKSKTQKRRILLIAIVILAVAFISGRYLFKAPPTPIVKEQLTKTYTGTLPCADCSGLVTTLTLIKPSSTQGDYILHEIYAEKMTTPIVTEGKWTITRGIPSDPEAFVLTLTASDPNQGVTHYLMDGDNKLTLLGQDKNKIDAPFNLSLTAKR